MVLSDHEEEVHSEEGMEEVPKEMIESIEGKTIFWVKILRGIC